MSKPAWPARPIGLALFTGFLHVLAHAALASPSIYIPNSSSGTVSVIDAPARALTNTVQAGNTPYGVAVNSAGTRVYVTNEASNNVSVIDTATNTVIATIDVGITPIAVAVNPAGTFAYVTNLNAGTVSVIDTKLNKTVATIATAIGPAGVAVNPAGTRVYVAIAGSFSAPNGIVEIIDTGTNKIIGSIAVGVQPQMIAIDSGGSRAYVTNLVSNTLSIIDINADRVIATLPTGSGPAGVAVNPVGNRVYVTNANDNTISIIDPELRAGRIVAVGATPAGIAVDAGNENVYVANFGSNNVSIIDPAVNLVVGLVGVGANPVAYGQFTVPAASAVPVVEFYNANFDHYFITWVADEIAALDAGTTIKGWARTGQSFKSFPTTRAGATPVCRFYIPPGKGDSHFFGRDPTECDATAGKNPTFILEEARFMFMVPPSGGSCPSNTVPVYRVFSNRPDANHRYTTDRATRDAMVQKGWVAEGDGQDLVVMCAPA